MAAPLWTPSPSRIASSHLTAFARQASRLAGRDLSNYGDLHRWSIDEAPQFWRRVWDFGDVIGNPGDRLVVDPGRMPGARFLPDARVNFAENLLRRRDAAPAIIATSEAGRDRRLSFADVHRDVLRVARALTRAGVRAGDRVGGIVANIPEAVTAALGAATIGAVWSSCSPDFGADAIVDRFGQIAPKALVAVDEYQYGGRRFDCLPKLAEVVGRLPTVGAPVVVRMNDQGPSRAGAIGAVDWEAWLAPADDDPAFAFERFPFDHPLYIAYSSGTTGAPKCIVHGAGGTLLQHLKEHRLHCDVRRDDRVFYFTTCGWMMWHWLVSALASEATIVLYDGSPFHPDGTRLFDLAAREAVTLFGVSPKFIDGVKKASLAPRRTHDLRAVRTIASTGSPLAPESFDFVYDAIAADVHLASISGGTDILSCFALGNPNGPVWRGELQVPGLGMDVRVYDEGGRELRNEPGELVCVNAFPAMPVGFWNDPGGAKYHAAYFEVFPHVWRHGDWVRTTEHGGFIIYGRSDATLKPGGVRIGTADIYRQVEQLPEIVESVAVGQEWQGDERIVLFVRLAPGVTLDEPLRRRIADRIRVHASSRHVPARIVATPDIPRTRSGKIAEIAIRRTIHGLPIPNADALANPESLAFYRDRPELQS